MGLAGAVRLSDWKKLEALPAVVERDALYRQHMGEHHAKGKAINMAAMLEIDAVISKGKPINLAAMLEVDPMVDAADMRQWLSHGLASARIAEPGRMAVDPW